LVELLVVIGIIAVLISILLPVLSGARRSATDMQCASNVRQLVTALIMYANENKGKFPPNINPEPPKYPTGFAWFDADRIGRFLPKTVQYSTGSIGGNVFICPRDEQAARSYSMNFWASGGVNTYFENNMPYPFWKAGDKPASQLILITEKFSPYGAEGQYATASTIGTGGMNMAVKTAQVNAPGKRFVGGAGISINTGGRFGVTPTEFDWSRHRRKGEGRTYKDADGRVNIGFADGHVSMFRAKDLADSTGRSKFEAFWTPMDREIQRACGLN
jgi:prepilin-type processing-associated H-X9-DG protein